MTNNNFNDQIKKAFDLIIQNSYKEAEQVLSEYRNQFPNDSVALYYLGYIYSHASDDLYSQEDARECFKKAIGAKNPVEFSFIEYAKLEKNSEHKKRILRKGLEHFPQSNEIYARLAFLAEGRQREEVLEEIETRGIIGDKITGIKLQWHIEVGDISDALTLVNKLNWTNITEEKETRLLQGFLHYEADQNKVAIKIFQALINDDIQHDLCYAPYFGLILCFVRQGKNDEAIKVFEDIPIDADLRDMTIYRPDIWFSFNFQNYILNALSNIVDTAKGEIVIRASGMRALIQLQEAEYDGNYSIRPEVIERLEVANKSFPNNTKICQNLQFYFSDQKQYYKVYQLGVQYLQNTLETDSFTESLDEAIAGANKTDFVKIINDFKREVRQRYLFRSKKNFGSLARPVIARLFEHKEYQKLIEICELMTNEDIREYGILFEYAFATKDVGNISLAKKLYQLLLEREKDNQAAINNLGVIFEYEHDFIEARCLYERAVQLKPKDKITVSNLKRVNEILRETNAKKLELTKVMKDLEQESSYVKSKLLQFASEKNEDGFIVCSFAMLPKLMSARPHTAEDLLRQFLEKKYILKTDQHSITTPCNVYSIHPEIVKKLTDLAKEIEQDREFNEIADSLNTSSLVGRGYDADLLHCLAKVSSDELRSSLERDMKENAICLIAGLYKSSLIMSGSIIEMVLLDRITSQKINSYELKSGRKKKIEDMTLNELLEVAQSEKLIADFFGYLTHALREFRNLVHPAVEQKKKYISVSSDDAKLAWDLLKKILKEI